MRSVSDVCVSVENISKKFSRSLKRSFIYGARDIGRAVLRKGDDDSLQKSEFWAVRNISFELRQGESIGVVGLNGSGKTTLMRMISGILKPTTGKISVQGRIAPMLALGAGFKPVLSGRENIFLNLSLLGIPPNDIRARFDSIVDFAELWDAIEAPIGTYSSGMVARLGFACAVHTEPQILVVDEVLSVGDTRFRIKCRNKINELRKSGTSMLLVSHSAILIETLSDRCLYLQRGKAAAYGAPSEVMKRYQSDIAQSSKPAQEVTLSLAKSPEKTEEKIIPDRHPTNRPLRITNIRFHQEALTENLFWMAGESGRIVVDVECLRGVEDISINLMIFDLEHQHGELSQFIVSNHDVGWLHLKTGNSEITLELPFIGLRPSIYRVKISISQGPLHDILDAVDNLKVVVRGPRNADNCVYFQPRSWVVNQSKVTPKDTEELDSLENSEEF